MKMATYSKFSTVIIKHYLWYVIFGRKEVTDYCSGLFTKSCTISFYIFAINYKHKKEFCQTSGAVL